MYYIHKYGCGLTLINFGWTLLIVFCFYVILYIANIVHAIIQVQALIWPDWQEPRALGSAFHV